MDGEEHISIASLAPDLFCVTFSGLSKSHMVAGYRVGWMVLSGNKKGVEDYIEGINLWDYLKKERPPLRQRCRIAIQVLEALSFLHTRDEAILYLDLKPENIMITREGELKLVDFGIAKRIIRPKNTPVETTSDCCAV